VKLSVQFFPLLYTASYQCTSSEECVWFWQRGHFKTTSSWPFVRGKPSWSTTELGPVHSPLPESFKMWQP